MGLLLQNMKPHVCRNGRKNILNGTLGCSLFPIMGATKEVDLHGV
jgi:hypothetical protein